MSGVSTNTAAKRGTASSPGRRRRPRRHAPAVRARCPPAGSPRGWPPRSPRCTGRRCVVHHDGQRAVVHQQRLEALHQRRLRRRGRGGSGWGNVGIGRFHVGLNRRHGPHHAPNWRRPGVNGQAGRRPGPGPGCQGSRGHDRGGHRMKASLRLLLLVVLATLAADQVTKYLAVAHLTDALDGRTGLARRAGLLLRAEPGQRPAGEGVHRPHHPALPLHRGLLALPLRGEPGRRLGPVLQPARGRAPAPSSTW